MNLKKARFKVGNHTKWVGKRLDNKYLQLGLCARLLCMTSLFEGVAMKALLLIAAVTVALAGCSMMPGHSSGSMPAQGAGQNMGSMNMSAGRDSWLVDDNGRPWTSGDGAFYGSQNR